jgi:hypothetical protein
VPTHVKHPRRPVVAAVVIRDDTAARVNGPDHSHLHVTLCLSCGHVRHATAPEYTVNRMLALGVCCAECSTRPNATN